MYRVGAGHTGAAGDRACLRFSTDEGATWTAENKFTDGGDVTGAPLYLESQDLAGPDAICKAPNSDLLVAVAHGSSVGGAHIWRSTDGGASWADDGAMGTYNTDTVSDFIVIGSNIYAVCYRGGINADWAVSSDNGATWTLVSNITIDEEGIDVNEFSVANPSGNNLVAVFRYYNGGYMPIKTSDDMGATWSAFSFVSNIGTIHRPIIKIFSDETGRIYGIGRNYYGITGTEVDSVEKTILFYSDDDGGTWIRGCELEEDYQVDCGYADILKRAGGSVYVLSYAGNFHSASIYEYIVDEAA